MSNYTSTMEEEAKPEVERERERERGDMFSSKT